MSMARASPADPNIRGRLRFAVDTGGTFTDLVVGGEEGGIHYDKRPTTPEEPVRGVFDVLTAVADEWQIGLRELLARGSLFVFGTTRATNAIVTGTTARTALLVTRGHPDVLLLREGGGRPSLFDYSVEYPEPYIPRALTFEVPERIGALGEVVEPLDEAAVEAIADELEARGAEAVAVSLLWSVLNPVHEKRVSELVAARLPGIPITVSHRLNPTIREHRRASSAAIDASLKPLMARFFRDLEMRLRDEGFDGRLLVMTSAGGVLDADAVRRTPIHSIGSGPAAAPIAGRHFASLDAGARTAIVTDAGGTTFDVSLIRDGRIPWTRETVVGHATSGYLTGFPSVDVRSIGAGGGSIASVDSGGLLHVGPESAGADPGPACYGRGGTAPTVTDACVVLGYIDPDYFLGGRMRLDVDAAVAAIDRDVARPLGVDAVEAASAVLRLATDKMVRAIEEITLLQGIDPRGTPMVAGGGGGGLYAVPIARRLRCDRVVIPQVSAALSATGELLSDLQADYAITEVTSTDRFDVARAGRALEELRRRADAFLRDKGRDAVEQEVRLSVEARYPHQVWEIEVPLRGETIASAEEVEELRQDFHAVHERLYAVRDPDSEVEVVQWRARVRASLGALDVNVPTLDPERAPATRVAHFAGAGRIETEVRRVAQVAPGERIEGPSIIESPVTTIVLDPGSSAQRTETGSLVIEPGELQAGAPALQEAAADG
jgi:N-methylhydantoinase A